MDMLEADGALKGAKPNLPSLKALGQKAGIKSGNYLSVHGLFEKIAPESHRRLLGFLGFSPDDIVELLERIEINA